jgi:hypothetical protein
MGGCNTMQTVVFGRDVARHRDLAMSRIAALGYEI